MKLVHLFAKFDLEFSQFFSSLDFLDFNGAHLCVKLRHFACVILALKHLFAALGFTLIIDSKFLSLVLQHLVSESIDGLFQVLDDRVLLGPFILETKQLFVGGLDVNPFLFSSELVLEGGNLVAKIILFFHAHLLGLRHILLVLLQLSDMVVFFLDKASHFFQLSLMVGGLSI